MLIKTHKLTVLLNVPSTSTVNDIKAEVLDALQSGVVNAPIQPEESAMDVDDEDEEEWEVPQVETTEDFELARQAKEKGRPTGRYEQLEVKAQLKNVLANWDPVFIQFKDVDGEWAVILFVFWLRAYMLHYHTIHAMNVESPRPHYACRLLPSTGGLLPVKVSIPSISGEEEEEQALSAARKGKRKAD